MITKITKLNNFGIFHDYKWNKEIPEFKKFNLIYGCNRSGKTTVSRIFSACEKKSIQFLKCNFGLYNLRILLPFHFFYKNDSLSSIQQYKKIKAK